MEGIEPLTAREALFAIRFAAEDKNLGKIIENVKALAEAGLSRGEMVNFELTDQLADRLAEAHKLLGEVEQEAGAKRGVIGGPTIDRIAAALALPPDLEAMVERRIGHGT